MKKIKEKFYLASVSLTTLMLTTPTIAFADKKGDEVQKKLSDAIGTIQGVLTGLIVAVGIVVALWIIIKRLPSADDPQEKNEVYKALGRVGGLVALGAAIVWILPCLYGLFT